MSLLPDKVLTRIKKGAKSLIATRILKR